MIGKTLGHYKILRKIGHGGMGEVYAAMDTKLDRSVALKVLPAEDSTQSGSRSRFIREAKAVAALTHPNIVTLYSVEDLDGHLFLTMELVEGSTLDHNLPRSGLPPKRFFKIAKQLAGALHAAHGKGITHRDLKPANVMVNSHGDVKILDFGLAKLLHQEPNLADETVAMEAATEKGVVLGTVAYMSPEQAEGRVVDHRSDIFSFGILLYEMATGRRPFHGEGKISILSSILRDSPEPAHELNRSLSPELGRLIAQCLNKEPDRRYQDALDIQNELARLEAEAVSDASSDSASAAVSGRSAPA